MTDSFGDKSDWIEIHNNGVTPVDLAGWKLEDGATTWTFPSEPTWANSVLGANSYLTVFASGQNTVTLGGTQLHTNFKLSSDGEYLGLLRPDNSVANEYAPQYPAQLGDISYGITETTSTSTLLTQGAAARILVPTSAAQLPAAWNSNTFDDSAAPWFSGTTGVGFEPAAGVLNETEPNNTTATANNASTNFVSVAATQYQLTWSGTAGSTQDWFKIGAMQAGDVLTITGSGSSSIPADTATDNDIQLWRAGSGSAVKIDADNGPGNDPLIDHFSVTTADTYYVMIQRKTSTSGGTYNVNVWLDNAGAAPTTGGTFTAEAESNDTLATANDASTSWRVAGYKSRTVGAITSGDIDVYQYQFTAGDEVSVNVTASGGLDSQVSLKNSAGTTLVKEDGTSAPNGVNTANSSIYAFKIPTTGTYYVQVQSSAATTGSYTADVYPLDDEPAVGRGHVRQLDRHESAKLDAGSQCLGVRPNSLQCRRSDGHQHARSADEVRRRVCRLLERCRGRAAKCAGTPGTPLAWNAAATASHSNSQAIVYEDIDLTSFVSSLVAGPNVLAIQGLNVLPTDTDFLMLPELDAGSDTITGTTFFSPPTPGTANTTPVAGQVATPTADKSRGFYNSAFYVTLTDATPGAQIRYTLTGTAPTSTTGTVYTGPISITQTTTLRFAAYESGFADSTSDTETYLFLGTGGAGNHPAGTVLGQSNTPAGYPANWVTIVRRIDARRLRNGSDRRRQSALLWNLRYGRGTQGAADAFAGRRSKEHLRRRHGGRRRHLREPHGRRRCVRGADLRRMDRSADDAQSERQRRHGIPDQRRTPNSRRRQPQPADLQHGHRSTFLADPLQEHLRQARSTTRFFKTLSAAAAPRPASIRSPSAAPITIPGPIGIPRSVRGPHTPATNGTAT